MDEEEDLNDDRASGVVVCINVTTGETARWDTYALRERGMPKDWQAIDNMSRSDWVKALRDALNRS